MQIVCGKLGGFIIVIRSPRLLFCFIIPLYLMHLHVGLFCYIGKVLKNFSFFYRRIILQFFFLSRSRVFVERLEKEIDFGRMNCKELYCNSFIILLYWFLKSIFLQYYIIFLIHFETLIINQQNKKNFNS